MKNLKFYLLVIFISFLPVTKLFAQNQFSNPTIFVGNVVTNLEKSVEFYTNVIGMTQTGTFSVDAEKAKQLGLSDKYKIDVTVLKLEDSPQANEWKLMSFGTKPGHKKPKWLHDDTGMQYITINVNHLDPFIERMKKNNIEILRKEVPVKLEENRYFILVQDPDGTFIELIGPR